jgi:DNA-binding transcriptional ArsR family regulator
MELSNSVTLLASLAHESRLRIFRQLVQAGPQGMTPMQLAERLNMPPPTLSFHLKELYQAGLTQKQKQGRSITYSANYQTMSSLIGYLQENCCDDDQCSTC